MKKQMYVSGGTLQNKLGFTLIELLAVIVILAIIALIATPIVLNIIKDSRESAQLRSAEMYLDAVEQSISVEKMNNPSFKPNECTITDKGNLDCDTKDGILEIKVNGDKPESGRITIVDGKIEEVTLTYANGKTIVKTDGKLVYGEKEETEEVKTIDTICTHDETNGVAKNTAGAKYSCEVKPGTSYTFYVLTTPAEGDTTINLIMDRNICEDGTPATAENTCLVAWISTEKYYEDVGGVIPDEVLNDGGYCQNVGYCTLNDKGPITAMSYLNNATNTWENIDNLNLTYDDENGHFTGFTLNGKARLPYKNEVSAYESTNKTNAYLYDYLRQSGTIQTNAISGITGYWLFSSGDANLYYVSSVVFVGSVNFDNPPSGDDTYGVRPVITLKI